MLRPKKEVITLNGEEVLEIEEIVMDGDRERAFRFLKKVIYDRILKSQKLH